MLKLITNEEYQKREFELTELTALLEQEKKGTEKLKGHKAELESTIKTLQANIVKKSEQEQTDIEQTAREKRLDAREKALGEFDKQIVALEAEKAAHGETQYKNGYSDGVADGLRKAHEITAEDRRMVMQVAALAAASHSPESAKPIAEQVAKMLPAMTSNVK